MRDGRQGDDDMAEQHIRIMCPNVVCRKIMAVPMGARGKIVQCPQCRKRIRIPNTASSAAGATKAEAPAEHASEKGQSTGKSAKRKAG